MRRALRWLWRLTLAIALVWAGLILAWRFLPAVSTLMAARHWTQQYEWQSHYKHAMKAGLNPAIAEAIAESERILSGC